MAGSASSRRRRAPPGASSASASPATRSTRAWAPRSSAGEGCRTCRASKPPVTMDADGTVSCATSFPSQGQGHATTITQLVADRLGVPMKSVRVLPVDTLAAPRGSGTFGSRGAVSMAGSAAAAADRLREKLQALAGHLLEASPADVAIEEGRASVRGFPDRAVTLAEVARLAYWLPH